MDEVCMRGQRIMVVHECDAKCPMCEQDPVGVRPKWGASVHDHVSAVSSRSLSYSSETSQGPLVECVSY